MLDRRYTYDDPIATLPESGRRRWAEREQGASGWAVPAELEAADSWAAPIADLPT